MPVVAKIAFTWASVSDVTGARATRLRLALLDQLLVVDIAFLLSTIALHLE